MISKHTMEDVHSHTKPAVADGWAKYHLAHELLEQSQWSQALVLLAQAESIFRTFDQARGLWRALIGQALLHWRDGMAEVAEARGLAALQAAETTDDGFAVGYVTWQLANLKIDQEQYAQAADYLDQAQLALDAVGLAPAGGAIAAAAQLCQEIVRWQQMCERQQISQRDAEAAIDAIAADLGLRLRRLASTMQIVAAQAEESEAAGGDVVKSLQPMILPPTELPGLPWIGLSAWLGRLWHKLIYGDESAAARRVLRAPIRPITDRALYPPPDTNHGGEEALGAMPTGAVPAAEAGAAPEHASPEPEELELPAQELLLADRALPKVISAPIVERASLPIDSLPTDAQIDPRAPAPKRSNNSTLHVRMFGPFRVMLNDCEVENWPSGRGRAVFKYLMTHRDRPLARDVLMETFWPEASPESARNSLNVALYGLRQALRAAADVSVVVFQNGTYRLNPDLQIWLDVEEFKRHVQAGRQIETAGQLAAAMGEYEVATELYHGDFFEDDLYEDWAIPHRESLKDSYLVILDRLSRYYLKEGKYTTCVQVCQKILAKDDCREDTHRRLMRCYSRQGQPNLALRQYQLCVETLARVLDMSPMEETKALYQKIRNRETV